MRRFAAFNLKILLHLQILLHPLADYAHTAVHRKKCIPILPGC